MPCHHRSAMPTLLGVAVIIAATACPSNVAADEPEKKQEAGAAVMGSWQDAEREDELVRFEVGRVARFERGKLTFERARYDDGRMVLGERPNERTIEWKIVDGRLHTREKGWGGIERRRVWERVEGVPMRLQARPMELGKGGDLDAEEVKRIQAEIARRVQADQAIRQKPDSEMSYADRWRMMKMQADYGEYVKNLARRIGWIDAQRFGAETSAGAFLLVQHSGDLELMLAVLPQIERDVQAGRMEGQYYALLYDRAQVFQALPQRYGTQVSFDERGRARAENLEDPARVDARRQEMGMEPLAEYLQRFK
jgi:hypothetical protein